MIEIPIRVNLTVSETQQQYNFVSVSERELQVNLSVDSPIVAAAYQDYDGEYTITPKTIEQILETKNKHMTDDVTVREIPYYAVSNMTGVTVYIGSNIND